MNERRANQKEFVYFRSRILGSFSNLTSRFYAATSWARSLKSPGGEMVPCSQKYYNQSISFNVGNRHKLIFQILEENQELLIGAMKTIFDENTRLELINRIGKINKSNKAEWGKMNVFQMLKHNTYWNRWILGKDNFTYKQAFLGKIFGKIALNKMIKDEKPFDKNIPTSSQFKVEMENGDFETERSQWILLLKEYGNYNNPHFVHDFFGKMTVKEIGILVYKHTDHHLRQFGI